MVEVPESPSLFFAGMGGSRKCLWSCRMAKGAPISIRRRVRRAGCWSAMRYLDNAGKATEVYPYNPNGSPDG
jgi:phosphoribosylformylglycinamidine synthase